MLTQGMCTSFKKELLEGIHALGSAGDTLKIALYDENASLTPETTAYTATNEISGTGYSAGGATLTVSDPTTGGTAGYLDLANVTWSTATFSARAALIYNSSKSNRAIAVLDFGSSRSANAQDFTVTFPSADQNNAIIRID